jgi:hypothetical protein
LTVAGLEHAGSAHRRRLSVYTAQYTHSAAAHVGFLTREIVDPMSERVFSGAASGGGSMAVESFRIGDQNPAGADEEIPPDLKSRLIEKLYRQYAGMADRSILILGDKTPHQSPRESGGERRVRSWLEGF